MAINVCEMVHPNPIFVAADVVEFDDLIKQVSQVMTIKAWIQLGGRHVRSAAFTKRVSLQELGKQRPPFACNSTRFIHENLFSQQYYT